jgi:hydrogenase maturation protease
MNSSTPASPQSVLLIGYGNPYRQDDRVGHVVAEQVASRCGAQGRGAVRCLTAYQLDLDMVEDLAAADRVYFIDAHTPDYSSEVELQQVAPAAPDGFTTHVFSPAHLVHLAGTLYGNAPDAFILSVPGASFDMGDDLSPGTALAAEQAVELLLQHLDDAGWLL